VRRRNVDVIMIESTLSREVQLGPIDAIIASRHDGAAKAPIVVGAGRAFIACAHIKEFGEPHQPSDLNLAISALETSSKPAIVALHGRGAEGRARIGNGAFPAPRAQARAQSAPAPRPAPLLEKRTRSGKCFADFGVRQT
jgi:hypothetical protein